MQSNGRAMTEIDDGAPVVFIHGIYGGRLRDQRERRWVGVKQALGLDRRPLTAPLTWGEGGQQRDGIQPDGVLTNVLWVDVYKAFLAKARRRLGHVEEFAYDWRRELPEAAAVLTQKLEEIAAKHGRPARIIAHSMGGLVTFLALRERPEIACGVLFAGTPFGTGIGFAKDTHVGNATGVNRAICSPTATCSWSAHWVFFPSDGDTGLRGTNGALDHDWYDPASWEHHRLGVFADDGLEATAYRAHLTEALTRARATRSALEDPGKLAGAAVPIAVLRSAAHDTGVTVVKDGPRAVRGWDVETVEFASGDGRVKVASTEPPGLPFEVYSTAKKHDGLLNDEAQVDAALAGLVSSRR